MARLPALPETQPIIESACDQCAKPMVQMGKSMWRFSPCRYGVHTAGHLLRNALEETIDKRSIALSKPPARMRTDAQRPFAQRLCRWGIRELLHGCGLRGGWYTNPLHRYAIEAVVMVAAIVALVVH